MYLLITPVRDEASNLPTLIESVASQSVLPYLWVIVDDCSVDNSAVIVREATSRMKWVNFVSLQTLDQYGPSSYSRTVRHGFEVAIHHAREHKIDYQYLGILDADIVPEQTYFEKLMHSLQDSEKLGIVSGQLYLVKNDRRRPEDRSNRPRGGARLYKRECFEQIGGLPECPTIDTISDIMASLRGWQTAKVFDAKAIHKRKTLGKKGLWYGYKMTGKTYYLLNYHPIYSLLVGLFFTVRLPFYPGIAFLIGYLGALVHRDEQSSDPLVRDYFWKSLNRLKKKLRAFVVSK